MSQYLHIPAALEPLAVEITSIYPDPANINVHDAVSIQEIAESIKQFGFMTPVVVNCGGMLIAGEGRYRGMIMLGATHIPAIVADHLSADELEIFAVADNATAKKSDFNELKLYDFVKRVREADSLRKIPGFTDEDLIEMRSKFEEIEKKPKEKGKTDYRDVKEADFLSAVPKLTHFGQIWQLGPHRIMVGDCTNSRHVAALMEDTPKASMVWADPPYGVDFQSNRPKDGPKHKKILNDAVILDYIPGLLTHADLNSTFYGCACHQNADVWRREFDRSLIYKNCVIWVKNNHGSGDLEGAFGNQYELIFVHVKGRPLLRDGRDVDVWNCDKVPPTIHPTQKPIELVARAVKNSTDVGSVVLDPFGGSCPSLVACEQMGRIARIMELEPGFIDYVVAWWNSRSDEKAFVYKDLS